LASAPPPSCRAAAAPQKLGPQPSAGLQPLQLSGACRV
jgi:hypothetical protein